MVIHKRSSSNSLEKSPGRIINPIPISEIKEDFVNEGVLSSSTVRIKRIYSCSNKTRSLPSSPQITTTKINIPSTKNSNKFFWSNSSLEEFYLNKNKQSSNKVLN